MSPRPDLGPKPRLGYTQNPLERAAELRADHAAMARFAAQPNAGAYVIGGEHIVMKSGTPLNEPLFTMAEARALGATGETVFLGLLGGAARFGYGIEPAAAEALKARDGFLVTDLRSIAVRGLVEPEHLPPIAEAKAVLHWHAAPPLLLRIAARRRSRRRPAGSAIARNARRNISRAPIRW